MHVSTYAKIPYALMVDALHVCEEKPAKMTSNELLTEAPTEGIEPS